MSQQAEPQRSVASVLVIAADPNIESLVGELVAFAGHRPLYDVTAGAAGESVRRARPDVTMVDTALDREVVLACLTAAEEVGSRPVLMSSTASSSELVEQAREQRCLFFPLPGGPKPLERVIERAISGKPKPAVTVPSARAGTSGSVHPAPSAREGTSGSVHPALCAALASVSRAHALGLRNAAGQNGHRGHDQPAQEGSSGSRSALRAAITDYSRQLKAADIAEEDALAIVYDAVSDCAAIVGADAALGAILRDSETWTRQVYRVA